MPQQALQTHITGTQGITDAVAAATSMNAVIVIGAGGIGRGCSCKKLLAAMVFPAVTKLLLAHDALGFAAFRPCVGPQDF